MGTRDVLINTLHLCLSGSFNLIFLWLATSLVYLLCIRDLPSVGSIDAIW